MRLGLLVILAAIPFLEIALLIKVGQWIGFLPTVALVVASAVIGGWVVREQGFQVIGRAVEAMSRGKPPLAPVIDGLFILTAGALLILPGFISDAVGAALLVPKVRHTIAIWSLRRVMRSGNLHVFGFGMHESYQSARGGSGNAGATNGSAHAPPAGDGPIIDGEFERIDERTIDPRRASPPPPPPGRE